LDLHRRKPMASDVDHVVDSPEHPVIAVAVAPGAVPGEIATRDIAPVLGLVPLVVAIKRPNHRRPGLLDHQETTLLRPPAFPSFVTMSGTMPGSGRVAEPGTVGVAPGSGEIMMAPVSVCHQVSTIGQRSLPITRLYHIHASGLIGSPTVPSRRRLERLCRRG